jgi:hypothetical protein
LPTARGKSSGAFFFGFFLLGKQKKETRVRSAERFQKTPRATARPHRRAIRKEKTRREATG